MTFIGPFPDGDGTRLWSCSILHLALSAPIQRKGMRVTQSQDGPMISGGFCTDRVFILHGTENCGGIGNRPIPSSPWNRHNHIFDSAFVMG